MGERERFIKEAGEHIKREGAWQNYLGIFLIFGIATMVYLRCKDTSYRWVSYLVFVGSIIIALKNIYSGSCQFMQVMETAVLGSIFAYLAYQFNWFRRFRL